MIKGDLTYLRAVEPRDLEILYTWENDTSNWLVSCVSTPFSKNTLKQYIESIQDIYSDKQLRLIICNSEKREVGTIDLFDFSPQNSRAGIGILIANKSDRNVGLATDALNAIIKYSFGTLHLNQLYCNILENNEASISLFESLGFVKCGEKLQWVKDGDNYLTEYTYQLIKDKT